MSHYLLNCMTKKKYIYIIKFCYFLINQLIIFNNTSQSYFTQILFFLFMKIVIYINMIFFYDGLLMGGHSKPIYLWCRIYRSPNSLSRVHYFLRHLHRSRRAKCVFAPNSPKFSFSDVTKP